MTKADTAYMTLGKIGSAFGVKGWLKVYIYSDLGADILDYHTWYLSQGHSEWKAYQVEGGHTHGKILLVKLAGINTPEEARLLTGKQIAIQRSELPPLKEGEYYWSDLIGLNVINTHHKNLGKVVSLMETGSNDVLIVKNDKEHAMPYLPGRVILKVDLEQQEILVDWEII